MKKIKSEKSLIKQNSKIAIAVAMLAVPMLYSPSTIFAQGTKAKVESSPQPLGQPSAIYLKFGPEVEFSIVGTDNNKHVILQNKNGDLCWMDANTGNLNFLPKEFKFTRVDDKHFEKVWVLGKDKNGDVIYKNANGDKFKLNLKGNMILVP